MLFTNLKAVERFNKTRVMAWNRDRVLKLCTMLQTTTDALAIMIGWTPLQMTRALARGKLPGPVCYILELWEQDALRSIGEAAANPCFDPVTPVRLALIALRKIASEQCESPAVLAAEVLKQFPPQHKQQGNASQGHDN